MGEFLRHEPCPRCGSKDNVAVYSDGKWCFGCGYRIPGYKGMSTEDIKRQLNYQEKKKNDSIVLPNDYSTTLRPEGKAWLDKYGITNQEINKYRIGWSDEYESSSGSIIQWPSLILPAFDIWGNLLLFQRRSFAESRLPKYHTKGSPDSILWIVLCGSEPASSLILVEDFVSCIKVGRQYDCSPLWGSNLSPIQITRISDIYENLILWLDWDKTKESQKLKLKAEPFFKRVITIATEKDPKDYADDIIRDHLGEV